MTSPKLKPQIHKQVPAKVTAYVDEGIKELVEKLNSYKGVWTSESCEGDSDECVLITIHYGEVGKTKYQKIAQLANELAVVLEDVFSARIVMEWQGAFKRYPFINLFLSKVDINNAIKALNACEEKLYLYRNTDRNKGCKSILC